jgi:hypothetical protein
MTSPKLLIAGLDQHKDSLEYLHINSINGRLGWESEADWDEFHGDEGSVASSYDPEDSDKVAEHKERQNNACKEIKQKYIEPIDIHEFKVLKTVSVHATDLLGAMNKGDAGEYTPLSTVLPASLQVLSLRYSNYFSDWDPQLEFVYRRDVGEDPDDAPWDVEVWRSEEHEAWYEIYFQHLIELLLHRTEKFPELKEIVIALQPGWPKPGREVMELADKVGVVLAFVDYVYDECPRTF